MLCPGRYAVNAVASGRVIASSAVELGPLGTAVSIEVPGVRTGRISLRFMDPEGEARRVPREVLVQALDEYAAAEGKDRVTWTFAQWGQALMETGTTHYSAVELEHAAPAQIGLSLVIDGVRHEAKLRSGVPMLEPAGTLAMWIELPAET